MTFEQAYVFGVLGATLCLFIWGRWRYDVVSVLALLAVAIPGIIDIDGVFAGFGHPAVITVAAVLAISKTLQGSSLIGKDCITSHWRDGFGMKQRCLGWAVTK